MPAPRPLTGSAGPVRRGAGVDGGRRTRAGPGGSAGARPFGGEGGRSEGSAVESGRGELDGGWSLVEPARLERHQQGGLHGTDGMQQCTKPATGDGGRGGTTRRASRRRDAPRSGQFHAGRRPCRRPRPRRRAPNGSGRSRSSRWGCLPVLLCGPTSAAAAGGLLLAGGQRRRRLRSRRARVRLAGAGGGSVGPRRAGGARASGSACDGVQGWAGWVGEGESRVSMVRGETSSRRGEGEGAEGRTVQRVGRGGLLRWKSGWA